MENGLRVYYGIDVKAEEDRFRELAPKLDAEQAAELAMCLLEESEEAQKAFIALTEDKDAPWRRDCLLVHANAAALAKLCGTSTRRFALGGVKVMATRGGYRIEAADGKVLGILTGNQSSDDEHSLHRCPKMKDEERSLAAIVPADAVKEAADMAERAKFAPESNVSRMALAIGKDVCRFVASGAETSRTLEARNVDGAWPDVNSVLPKQKPAASATFDIKMLIKILTVASAYSDKVTLELHGAEKPASLRCGNVDTGQKFVGLIMPLVV